MRKMFKKVSAWFVGLCIAAAMVIGSAMPAQAVTMSERQYIQCSWVHVYIWYDYNWWEETFYGYQDHQRYSYSYYKYNRVC